MHRADCGCPVHYAAVCAHTSPLNRQTSARKKPHHARLHGHNSHNLSKGCAVYQSIPSSHRALGLTALNIFVVAKFAEVLYQATFRHPVEQAGVTLLFVALVSLLAHTWFLALSSRRR